ncbi:MAG: hypothetical protein ABI743_15150, partial [bacterium]
ETYTAQPPLWIKPDGEELRFYWVVQLPETPGYFMPSVFKIPPVTAVGSAKAFHGTRGPDSEDDLNNFESWAEAIELIVKGISGSNDSDDYFSPQYQARLCPTSTDFILHFYLLGPNWVNPTTGNSEDYYANYCMLPSLWGGVIH